MREYIQTAMRPLAYQENMLTGKELARRISFGAGAATLDLPQALYEELEACDIFTALEVPGNFSDFFTLRMRQKVLERFPFLQAGSPASGELMRNIASQVRYQEEFIRNICSLLENIFANGIKRVLLDFPMEIAIGAGKTPEGASFLKKILKNLFPVLVRNRGLLLLPCRIPALPGGPSPEEFSFFLRESVMSNISAALQIHPHEIPRDGMDMEKLLGSLALDTGSIAFRYDAENGHLLVKGHLAPFLQYLLARGYRGGCFVIPFSNGNRLAVTEFERFAHLAALLSGGSPEKRVV